MINFAGRDTRPVNIVKSCPTDAGLGVRVINSLVGASSAYSIDFVESIGADASLRTVYFIGSTDVITFLCGGIVDCSVSALLASVVNDKVSCIAVASSIAVLAVHTAERLALEGFEVIVKSLWAFVANVINSVKSILAEACPTLVVFIFSTDGHTLHFRVESESILAFCGNASTLSGFVSCWACWLTETIEKKRTSFARPAIDDRKNEIAD